MIADDRETPLDVVLRVVTLPVWGPIYLLRLGWVALRQMATGVFASNPDVAAEAPQSWTPATDLERQVFAAMILAGRPVTNAELARLMGVSPAESSKRVAELKHLLDQGVLQKERVGREVRISLPCYH